jgi:hypothetical protein
MFSSVFLISLLFVFIFFDETDVLDMIDEYRIPSLIEHILVPLKSGLVDVSPYVRKTAAAGCAKVFHFSPESIRGFYISLSLSHTHKYTPTLSHLSTCKRV